MQEPISFDRDTGEFKIRSGNHIVSGRYPFFAGRLAENKMAYDTGFIPEWFGDKITVVMAPIDGKMASATLGSDGFSISYDIGETDTAEIVDAPLFVVRMPDGTHHHLRYGDLFAKDESGEIRYITNFSADKCTKSR